MSESNADNHSNLRLARSDLGGEYVPRDREAEVQDFVEQELGLDILKNFSKNKGRRRSKPPLTFEFRRDLTLDDALAMQSAPARTTGQTGGVAPLVRIRTVHHQIARMLADGTKIVNICAVLGITPARVQQLKNDPAFAELLAHYEQCEEDAEISLRHRFYLLGSTGMEELHERLLEDPDSFGNGHLMELVKLTVGGEAPKSGTNNKAAGGLPADVLERLKQVADSQARGRITYRKEVGASDGETSDS